MPVVDLFDEPRAYDPANISGDGFHPNDAGYAVLAELFNATLGTTRASSPTRTTPAPARCARR